MDFSGFVETLSQNNGFSFVLGASASTFASPEGFGPRGDRRGTFKELACGGRGGVVALDEGGGGGPGFDLGRGGGGAGGGGPGFG